MLKPRMPKFRPDLSARLKDIAEEQVPAKLKPIVGDVTSQCRVQKQDRWNAEVARGTNWKHAFLVIGLTWGKFTKKFTKPRKSAKHGSSSGPISGQPGV